MNGNYLTVIPKSILNLTEMVELIVGDNEEWEEFPLEVLHMPKLQKLEVDQATYEKYKL